MSAYRDRGEARRERPRLPPPESGAYPHLGPIAASFGVEHLGALRVVLDVGEHEETRRVQLDLHLDSGTVRGVDVQVDGGPFPDLELRREVAADREGKARAIASEPQLGDPEFDAKVYVDSDVDGAALRRAFDEDVRAAIVELVSAGVVVRMGPDGVRARLDAPHAADAREWSPRAMRPKLDALLAIGRTKAFAAGGSRRHRPGNGLVALASAALLPASGAMLFALDAWTPSYELPLLGALGGAFGGWLLRPAIERAVRGDAGSYRRYRILVALSLALGACAGIAIAVTVNGALDGARVELHGRVVAIDEHDAEEGKTSVEIELDDGERGRRDYDDRKSELAVGNPVVERWGRGRLGFRWRESSRATSGASAAAPKK